MILSGVGEGGVANLQKENQKFNLTQTRKQLRFALDAKMSEYLFIFGQNTDERFDLQILL